MSRASHLRLAALVLILGGGTAHAGVIDIGGMMGGANIYTLGNFTSQYSDVQGALLSGGNVTVGSYSINANNMAAYGSHAVIARGDLTLKGGSINNGTAYAGGKASLQNLKQPTLASSSPVDFDAASSAFLKLSGDLAAVQATGSVTKRYSGVLVSGTGKGNVDVFNVSAEMFRTSSSWTLENLVMGQTLIFNVSGANATFNNGGISFEQLSGYNVLFNFPDATALNVKGIIGSVLAPKAAVTYHEGVINGQVVVGSWNSGIQVNANHYFTPVSLAGVNDLRTEPQQVTVPEPGTFALMLAGVGVAFASRRKRAIPSAA